MLLEEVDGVDESGVVLLVLLVSGPRCVESDEAWTLLDELLEVVFVFVSLSGSVLMWMGATFCLRVGVELSLWTRARRGDGGDGICARPGILGLKVALVRGYIVGIAELLRDPACVRISLSFLEAPISINRYVWMDGWRWTSFVRSIR